MLIERPETTGSTTVAVRVNNTPSEALRGSEAMTYAEALARLHACEKKFQNARKARISDYPTGPEHDMEFYTFLKSMGISFAAVIPSFIAQETPAIIDDAIIFPFLANGLAFIITASTGMNTTRLMNIFSPFKARKIARETALVKALYEIKESDFKEKEAKILKKARPLVDIINSHIIEDGKEVYFQPEYRHGHQPGFLVFVPENKRYFTRPLTVELTLEEIPKEQNV
jgi:hypothetical protein